MKPAITPRERVWQAIRHKQPDIVPYQINATIPARASLEAHFGTTEIDDILGNHIARYKSRLEYEPLPEPGLFLDEWGVVWNKTVDKDIGVPQSRMLEDRDLSALIVPDPLDRRRYAALPAFLEKNKDRFKLFSVSFSLFERAWTLRGMEALMIDMVEAPEFVEALLDRIFEWDMAVLDEMLTRRSGSVAFDGVLFGDDWGQQRGLMFGAKRWRQFIKPRVAAMYRKVADAGAAVCIHSCGKVQDLFPELIEIGLQVFNPFQPEVMDLWEMKAKYGKDLAFYGGVSVQRLLPFGRPDEVRREVRRMLDELGQGGGFIIAPSHEMPGDIPLDNMLAFIETVRGQA
jgi:uroporphyrinogen decarboxylase